MHAFLEANTVEEEYIVMVDTDMFFRAPVDPASLGVRRGNVVSAEYTYLHGTTSGFADRFIPKELQLRSLLFRHLDRVFLPHVEESTGRGGRRGGICGRSGGGQPDRDGRCL